MCTQVVYITYLCLLNNKYMKLTWKGYWKPTPKNIRKVADSLLGAATLASTFSCMYDHPTLGVVVMVVAVITKIVSNFLSDDETIN